MDTKGRLKDIKRNIVTGKWEITFESKEELQSQYTALMDRELSIKAVPYRKKRSLDANSYYWVLLSKVADVLHISNAYAHNRMLRRYGEYVTINGKVSYMLVHDGGEKEIDESETYHLKPTSKILQGKDGRDYRMYLVLLGSSYYDTKQMSRLIEGLVDEAKGLGIETLSHEDLTQMFYAYAKERGG